MGSQSKRYSEEVAVEIQARLDHLARTPKGLNAKELVFQLRPKIEAAIASGYSLDDVVNVFLKQKVQITLNTLKHYLQESRKLDSRESTNPPVAKSRKAKGRSSSFTSVSVPPDLPVALDEVNCQLLGQEAESSQSMQDSASQVTIIETNGKVKT